MKLSEAIKQGTKETRSLHYAFFKETERNTYACVLGAACYAVDPARVRAEDHSTALMPDLASSMFPELKNWIEVPVGLFTGNPDDDTLITYPLGTLIVNLFDDEGWTRLRVAKYLETLGY